MSHLPEHKMQTKRLRVAYVSLCRGCCCGSVEKGRPEVPVEWMKAKWKEHGLKKNLQLTISGCLGPCDLANVVSIATGGQMMWLGGLEEFSDYAALLQWARESAEAERALPLPRELNERRFDPFRRPGIVSAVAPVEAIGRAAAGS